MIQNPLGGYSYLICVGEITSQPHFLGGRVRLKGGKRMEERGLRLKGDKRKTIYHGLPIMC